MKLPKTTSKGSAFLSCHLDGRDRPHLRFFEKGNTWAKKENMSADAHARRIAGLMKTWANQERQKRGEEVVTHKMKVLKARRKRAVLMVTLAKEAREIQDTARCHASQALQTLAEIMASEASQDTARIAAAQVILDRAYGKATQTNVNANVDANGKPSEVSAKELDTRIKDALNRVEAIAGRAAKAPEGKEQPADVRKYN